MSSGRFYSDDPSSYRKTGIPCGAPQRYSNHSVLRMVPDKAVPFKDQRVETPLEKIETESDRQLKEVLSKQLDTSASLLQICNSKKEFEFSSIQNSDNTEKHGSVSFKRYLEITENDDKVTELRDMGLSHEEIELYLMNNSAQETPKKMRSKLNPLVEIEKMKAIHEKINRKLEKLQKPDTFSGVKIISRLNMDLENAINFDRKNSSLKKILLTTDTQLDENEDKSHPINQINKIWKEVTGKDKPKSYPRKISENDSDFIGPLNYNKLDSRHSRDDTNQDSSKVKINVKNSSTSQTVSIKTLMAAHHIHILPSEYIERHRLSVMELKQIDRFKNYEPGTPSEVLFVKNLNYKSTVKDLASLFGVFEMQDEKSIELRICNGRMRGQAFVSFSEVSTASKALNLVNGYILQNRPIVVTYSNHNGTKNITAVSLSEKG